MPQHHLARQKEKGMTKSEQCSLRPSSPRPGDKAMGEGQEEEEEGEAV